MEFSLSNQEKIDAINFSIKEFEKSLILRLSAIGIDFEDFNPETFRNEADPQKGSHEGIIGILDKIEHLQNKKQNLL